MELGADGPSNGQSSRISCGSNGAVTDKRRTGKLFGGSIRFSTAALRSGEYPMSSSYPANLKIRDK